MKLKIVFALSITVAIGVFVFGCNKGPGTGEIFNLGFGYVASNEELLQQAAQAAGSGEWQKAIDYYNRVLSNSPDAAKQAVAYTGRGWATAQLNGIASAKADFEKVKDVSDEAKIGLALAYISLGKVSEFSEAIKLLNQAGVNSSGFTYQSAYHTGMSTSDLHAAIAYLYAVCGDGEKARKHITSALNSDPVGVASIARAVSLLGVTLESN